MYYMDLNGERFEDHVTWTSESGRNPYTNKTRIHVFTDFVGTVEEQTICVEIINQQGYTSVSMTPDERDAFVKRLLGIDTAGSL